VSYLQTAISGRPMSVAKTIVSTELQAVDSSRPNLAANATAQRTDFAAEVSA